MTYIITSYAAQETDILPKIKNASQKTRW